ncbi:hypothetical protein SAMN06296386_10710 [Lachnospiraceae bacterium]|nr:hypothetical protein SAMN06296386_10710 [Lachnospiraceae bacterium]
MLLKVSCISEDGTNGVEICTLYGIRFNKQGFAILSTEHEKHDYLIPMTEEAYDMLCKSYVACAKSGAAVVELVGGSVYRLRKNAMFLEKIDAKYAFKPL